MDRSLYNRKKNLELVVDAVVDRWNIPLTINERDDIVMYGVEKVCSVIDSCSAGFEQFILYYKLQ